MGIGFLIGGLFSAAMFYLFTYISNIPSLTDCDKKYGIANRSTVLIKTRLFAVVEGFAYKISESEFIVFDKDFSTARLISWNGEDIGVFEYTSESLWASVRKVL